MPNASENAHDPGDLEPFHAQRWIALERLRLVNRTLPVTLFVSIATASLLAALLRNAVPITHLVIWFVFGALVQGMRYLHHRKFMSLADADIDPGLWTTRLKIGTGLSGLFWGSAGAGLFPSGDLPHQVIITFALAGLSAGAMTSYAAIRRCYFLFVLPTILPIAVRMIMEGTEIHYTMAALTILFLGVIVRAAVETDRMINNVLTVRAENVELTRALRYQATHDPLVDLVNHREFTARLTTVARQAQQYRDPYALLFVDLDRFKEVNDTAGHAAGDEALRQIGQILKSCIRTHDTAARMGGDEFAVLLPACNRDRAIAIATRTHTAIAQFTFESGGRELRVGASIGVAYTDAGEHGADAMLRAADSACYAAKNNGRGRIEIRHADPDCSASGRFEISKLRRAARDR